MKKDLVRTGNTGAPVVRRALTPAQFGDLAEVPPELEWLANLTNPKTRRAYRIDVEEFIAFAGLGGIGEQHSDRSLDFLLDFADDMHPLGMFGPRAVAEVQPEHVGPGVEQGSDLRFGRAGRAQCGNNFDTAAASHVLVSWLMGGYDIVRRKGRYHSLTRAMKSSISSAKPAK